MELILKQPINDLNYFRKYQMIFTNRSLSARLVIAFFLCFSAFSAQAQFTYLGAGLGYEITPYRANFDALTTHQSIKWNAGILYRPIRHWGIGVSIGTPLFQFTTFSFADSPTPDGSSFYNYKKSSSESRERYRPDVYEYGFDYGTNLTLLLRYFATVEQGLYLDLRLTRLKISEHFEMQRKSRAAQYSEILAGEIDYGAVSAVSINYENQSIMLIPGFAVGFMKNLTERLKLDAYFGLDILKFKTEPFSFRVSHDWDIVNDKTEYVDITSQTNGIKTMLTFNVDLNYSF